MNVVVSIDNWPCAIQTHDANFRKKACQLDLGDVESAVRKLNRYKDIDLIMGGPPCQDFSPAGRGIEGERANLTKAYAEIVARVSPPYFIMENVPTALKSNAYASARAIFEAGGYSIAELIVDAAFFGVPQHRRRLIVIGAKEGELASFEQYLDGYASILPLSVRHYWPEIGVEHYYRHPRSYARRAVFSIDEPSPTIRGVNRPRPKTYCVLDNDSTEEPVAALSSMQRARLQSFPESYKWVGTKAEIEQMIGNSVPPLLGKAVLQAFLDWNDGKTLPLTFKYWMSSVEEMSDLSIRSVFSALKAYAAQNEFKGKNEEECLLNMVESLRTVEARDNLPLRARKALSLYSAHLEYLEQEDKRNG